MPVATVLLGSTSGLAAPVSTASLAGGEKAIAAVAVPIARPAAGAAHATVKLLADGTRAVVESLPQSVTKPAATLLEIAGVTIPQPDGDDAPRVVRARHRLQCVPFARAVSGIEIYGNAKTWWNKAKGAYSKLTSPKEGAVMVFASTKRIRLGHVAVVKEIVSSREVKVDHANWGNSGRIYLNAPVVDVSRNNDWSEVRVWNARLHTLGSHTYRLSGFLSS